MSLADKTCIPCQGGVPSLSPSEASKLAAEIPEWRIVDNHHLVRQFTFPDFATGLAFVNRIGAIAEEQGHHPDILLAWGRVGVTIWTHKVDGLTESDFILAAKADQAFVPA